MTYRHLSDENIKEIQKSMPHDGDVLKVVNVFKLFGDQTRLNIMLSLFEGELCVHDICKVVNMSQSAVSHQLRNLREAKLVKSRRDGKEVLYSLDDEHVKEIFEIGLTHVRELK